MRKRFIALVILLFLLNTLRLFSGGGQEKEEAVQPGMSFVDDRGEEIVLRHKPQRIISGTLMTDEILLALVEKDRILAVTSYAEDPDISNVASQVDEIPNKLLLNVESYISLQPDLIFLANWSKAESVQQLRDAGLNVYLIETPATLKEIKEKILAVTHIVGEKSRGEELIQWMERKIKEVTDKISGLSPAEKLKVMDYLPYGTSFGRGSSWDEIVHSAGLINAVGSLNADQWGIVPISEEKLIDLDPDILILPGWIWGDPQGSDSFFSQIVSDPALSSLKAVQTGKVFRIPEKHKTTTSQYIVLGIEDLARFAYPELFR